MGPLRGVTSDHTLDMALGVAAAARGLGLMELMEKTRGVVAGGVLMEKTLGVEMQLPSPKTLLRANAGRAGR